MSKDIFIGIDNIAHTVKQMFVGVDDTASKVKKGYIGVGGIARPFFSAEPELSYYGELEPLLYDKEVYLTTILNNHALIVPCLYDFVDDSFDEGMESSIPTYLSVRSVNTELMCKDEILIESEYLGSAVANVGQYAIFPGRARSPELDLDPAEGIATTVINSDFTVNKIAGLIEATVAFSGASNSKYAVFYGGEWGNGTSNAITAYDDKLSRYYTFSDSMFSSECTASNFMDCAVFVGGSDAGTFIRVDTNLLLTELPSLYSSYSDIYDIATAVVGDYLLFAGGVNYPINYLDEIVVCDKNFVKLTPISLLGSKADIGATSVKDRALFIGGTGFDSDGYEFTTKDVEIFDSSLLRCDTAYLNKRRWAASVVSLNDYLLLAGGIDYSDSSTVGYTCSLNVYTYK